jgi:hypothetical protein
MERCRRALWPFHEVGRLALCTDREQQVPQRGICLFYWLAQPDNAGAPEEGCRAMPSVFPVILPLGNYQNNGAYWRSDPTDPSTFTIYDDGKWSLYASLLYCDAGRHCFSFSLRVNWRNNLRSVVLQSVYDFNATVCEGNRLEKILKIGTDDEFVKWKDRIDAGDPHQEIHVRRPNR